MIVVVNTPIMTQSMVGTPWNEIRSVVTFDTRTVFLLGPLGGSRSKIHWALRNNKGTARPYCGVNTGTTTTWTGKVSDLTCTKCLDKWWTNERLLGAGGAAFIQNGHG